MVILNFSCGRRAVRRSQNGAVDEAVYKEHPQLERLLQTLFRVVLIGCHEGASLRQTLPPSPPPLHFAVHPCAADEAQLDSHTLAPLMTSMTSPLALARDETVATNQLRCARGYHQSHSNHSHQPGQANRAARRNSGARALSSPLPFSILPTPSRRQRVKQTTSSCPKQASRPKHYRPQGYALSCLRLLNCPIPSHFQAELYHLSLQIARRFREHKHLR